MKRIAALTMVRNDDFFLARWVAYYGSAIGLDNLYIFFDGEDQKIPGFCEGTHTESVKKMGFRVVDADKERIKFLSGKAAALLQEYDLVIGTDADEFLVVDPDRGMSLAEYLSSIKIRTSVSALGIDMGQYIGKEDTICDGQSFLSQRHYGLVGTRYTKASVIARKVAWGSGFHRVKGHNFHIAEDLYLFHFGYCDLERIKARFSDKDRTAQGWTRHIAKRSRTIRIVSSRKAGNFDSWIPVCRFLQSVIRPPYAWNKPAMFNLDIVLKIPDRFQNII